MLTIKDDSLRYYTISYAIFNQLSYLINSSGQMLSECLTVGMSERVGVGEGEELTEPPKEGRRTFITY